MFVNCSVRELTGTTSLSPHSSSAAISLRRQNAFPSAEIITFQRQSRYQHENYVNVGRFVKTGTVNSSKNSLGRSACRDALSLYNSLEAIFWMSPGGLVFWKSRSNPRHRPLGLVAAGWFVLFGASDVWEVFTGAWWRPWPLLLLKGICVISLIFCAVIYRNTLRQDSIRPDPRQDVSS
jgi:hypothetical protein